ncbi:UNVERIFIED_CONTAM: hypothetical protein Sradi_4634600 [Sesamum radiatum]|uniref:Uncharacterized protein n=1 Tax=Sesamum radiatum TaxID=300843 RepID=A0AAW2NDG7_SESRA
MAKSSSSRFILRYFHHIASKPSTSGNPTSSAISHFIADNPKIMQNRTFSSWLPTNSQRTHFSSSANNIPGIFGKLDPQVKFLPSRNLMGFRYFSFKNFEMGSKNFAKKVVENPALAVKNTFARWGCGVHLLWRVLFGIANTFIGFSEGMAKYGFLALSSAIVAFTGLYFRSKYTINPDKVYRMAMRKLNTSAGILEVMGAPLTGTDLRAYIMSGGGVTLKNFQPSLRSKRCFLIFPIRGSERKGLVSVEVKKKKGQYDMKLLAVDIPMASGPDQRLFLIGDEEEYKIGGGLIPNYGIQLSKHWQQLRSLKLVMRWKMRKMPQGNFKKLKEGTGKKLKSLKKETLSCFVELVQFTLLFPLLATSKF